MPATVVVGTQWGDEGKGKLTDILAGEMDMVVRYQGGHNAGHTIVVGERSFAVRLVPERASSTRTSSTSSATASWSTPASCSASSTRSSQQGIDTDNLVVSGNAHLILPVPRRARRRVRAPPRQEQARHHQERHRPGLRRQGGPRRPAGAGPARPEDLPREARGRARPEGGDPGQGLQPPGADGRRDLRPVPRRDRPAARAPHRRLGQPHPRGPRGRQAGDVRGRPGDVPRPRPRHVSVRHVVEPGRRRRLRRRRRRAPPHRPRHRHHQGVPDPRRLGAVPHRAARSPRATSATASSTAATSTAPTPAAAAGPGGSTR